MSNKLAENLKIIKISINGKMYYSLAEKGSDNYLDDKSKTSMLRNVVTISYLRDRLHLSCEEIAKLTLLKGVKTLETTKGSYLVSNCSSPVLKLKEALIDDN